MYFWTYNKILGLLWTYNKILGLLWTYNKILGLLWTYCHLCACKPYVCKCIGMYVCIHIIHTSVLVCIFYVCRFFECLVYACMQPFMCMQARFLSFGCRGPTWLISGSYVCKADWSSRSRLFQVAMYMFCLVEVADLAYCTVIEVADLAYFKHLVYIILISLAGLSST